MVVEGVFVQNEKNEEETISEFRAMTAAREAMLKKVFKLIDTDKSGQLTLSEFETAMSWSSVQALLTDFGLSVSDATIFVCALCEMGGEDSVSIDDFVSGCLRLGGEAESLDVQILLFTTRSTE